MRFGLLCAGLLAVSVSTVNAQPRWEDAREPQQARSEHGFVFLDGEYVPPPYNLKIVGTKFTINDRVATETPASPETDDLSRRAPFPPDRRGPRGRREFGPPPFPRPGEAKAIADLLDDGAVFVYFTGRPHLCLARTLTREEFLQCLVESEDRIGLIERLTNSLAHPADREQWRTWLVSYVPPPQLADRAQRDLSESAQLEKKGRDAYHSQQRLQSLAYPLTVLGMCLGVFALGHLLQSPPDNRLRAQSTRRCARHCRAAVISLVLIALLSGLDLTWTLLASQAGQMTELNPIGHQLLDQPTMLSALKVGSTFLSCGVLLMIRRHPRAQQATWWLCLICTVLTFRWLVLNSMFVA